MDNSSFDNAEQASFYSMLETFIDCALEEAIPSEVKAVCFNLYEDEGSKWSMEIIGTSSFDKDDPDWACDEVSDFGTRNVPFYWTEETDWESVLSEITKHLEIYLSNGACADKLKSLEGVAVGFTDGNLNILVGD